MPTTDLINTADRIAPAPTCREGANRTTWVKHYAAQALACWATFRAEIDTLPRNPKPGSRPDIGYLALAAVSSTTAAVALTEDPDAPELIWDLTPEAGALNGEWEEWLADVLVRYGINPGDIDPELDPADFTEPLRTHGPSNQPYVCPDCGETAYLHFPECPQAATQPTARLRSQTAALREALAERDRARTELEQVREAAHRRDLGINAERTQWQAEIAHLRDLIDQHGDDGMIPAAALRKALRDGPPLDRPVTTVHLPA